MVVSTRSVQSLLLPLARKSLGLPLELGHESGADAATQESVASSLQVANVAIRAPIDSDLASNPFVLPMEQLALKSGLLAKASECISITPTKAIKTWQDETQGAESSNSTGSTGAHEGSKQELTREEQILTKLHTSSGVDFLASLLHHCRCTRARCLGHSSARTVPSAVSVEEQAALGFEVPVSSEPPLSFLSDGVNSELESLADLPQLRTLAAAMLLALPSTLDRRRLIKDLLVFCSKEPADWNAMKSALTAEGVEVKEGGEGRPSADDRKRVARLLKRERTYRWSVLQRGLEGSQGGDHHRWPMGRGLVSKQREEHLLQFERVMLSHASTSNVPTAIAALAIGDQKLIRLATMLHLEDAAVDASRLRVGSQRSDSEPEIMPSGGSVMVGGRTTEKFQGVDDDTSGSDEGGMSDGRSDGGDFARSKSPTLDMGFYQPAATSARDGSSDQNENPIMRRLPKFSKLHTSTDRLAGMPAPPRWLRWVGLVQADGSLADAGHYHAYRGDSRRVTADITSDVDAQAPIFGRVRVRSSMVRAVDSAIKTSQLSMRTLAFEGKHGQLAAQLVKPRPNAAMVALVAAVQRSAGDVPVEQVHESEHAKASRRAARQLQEAKRSKLVAARIKKKKDQVIAMVTRTLRPFGRAAVRHALEPIVQANDSRQQGDNRDPTEELASDSRALVEMQPHLGPAFRPLYPLLKAVMRELTKKDLDIISSLSRRDWPKQAREGTMSAQGARSDHEALSCSEPDSDSAAVAWRDARLPSSGTLTGEWSSTLRRASEQQNTDSEHSASAGSAINPDSDPDSDLEHEFEHEPQVELDYLSGQAEDMLNQLVIEVELELSIVGEDAERGGEGDSPYSPELPVMTGATTSTEPSIEEQAASAKHTDLCQKLVLLLPPADLVTVCKQLRSAKRRSWNADALIDTKDRLRQRLGVNAIALEKTLMEGLLGLEASTLEAQALKYYNQQSALTDLYQLATDEAENRSLVQHALTGWKQQPSKDDGGDDSDSDDEGQMHEALQAWRSVWKEQDGGKHANVADAPLAYLVGDEPNAHAHGIDATEGSDDPSARTRDRGNDSEVPSSIASPFARELSATIFDKSAAGDELSVLDGPFESARFGRLSGLASLEEEGDSDDLDKSSKYDVSLMSPTAAIDASMIGPAAHAPAVHSEAGLGGHRLGSSPFNSSRQNSLKSADILGVVRAPLRLEARLVLEKVTRKLAADAYATGNPIDTVFWQSRFDDGLSPVRANGEGVVPAPCHDGEWNEDVEMRSVVVEGVPPGTTTHQLKEALRGLGEVQAVRFVGARTQARLRGVRERILRRALAEQAKQGAIATSRQQESADAAETAREQASALDEHGSDQEASVNIDGAGATFRTSHAMQAGKDGRKSLVRRVARAQKQKGARGSAADASMLSQIPPLLLAFDTAIEARYGPVRRVLGEQNLPLSVYNEPVPAIPSPSDAALPVVQPQTQRKGLTKLLRHEITQIERIVSAAPAHALVTFADVKGAAAAGEPEIRIFGVVVGATACRIRPAEGQQVLHVGGLPSGVTPLSLQLQLNSALSDAGVTVGLSGGRQLPRHIVSADSALMMTRSLRDALVLERVLQDLQLRPGKFLQVSYCSKHDWTTTGRKLHGVGF